MRQPVAIGTAGILLALALGQAACSDEPRRESGPPPVAGDPAAGARAIAALGCGTCHTIPGIDNATGLVGPPLNKMARRVYIAGLLRNTPDNMVYWIRNPQAVVPGNAMPDMGIDEDSARDITAYLYTLR